MYVQRLFEASDKSETIQQRCGLALCDRNHYISCMHDHDSSDDALALADRLCKEKGLSLTPVRRRVLELLLEADGPVKAYDLLTLLKPGGNAQPPTVYRALDFLSEAGLIHKVEALNAYMACVHGEDEGGAELFICENCGRVIERHLDNRDVAEGPDGFVIRRSVIEHYGSCEACSSEESS